MKLHARSWGEAELPEVVLCVHGMGVNGEVYRQLGERLARRKIRTVALDLRGHGASPRQPPWSVETHVTDIIETVGLLDVEPICWIGHSFGGRVVVELLNTCCGCSRKTVLLEPGLCVSPDYALEKAELERLDWSFASVAGATNALLTPSTPVHARGGIERFAKGDLRRGPDGRLRFSVSPSAVAVAWSELAAPFTGRLPEDAEALVVLASAGDFDEHARDRLREALGAGARVETVPFGHNVLWEAPNETAELIEAFLVGSERPHSGAATWGDS